MNRAALFLVLILFASCATTSPKSGAPAPTVPAPAPEPPALLWEAKNDTRVIYLFGTMHFGVAWENLPSTVGEALSRSRVVVLESDPSSADQTELADLMMLPPGPGLDEQLGAERWAKLLVLLDGMFDERTAKRLQPWVLETALTRELLHDTASMEGALLAAAEQNSMVVEYLEGWKAPIVALNNVSTIEALGEIVDDPEGFKERTHKMTQDYLAGDAEALHEHVFGPDYTAPALFADRNRAWLERLEQAPVQSPVFVAVGVGHLLGAESLLTLLSSHGYEVRRVPPGRGASVR